MTDQPLVSVIVPAWNAAATLLETLESAGRQTHRNLEILVVDDGATDRTAEIAAGYCARDSRARLIQTENRGLASARNRAIDEARGEFIAPLDADDIWHPEKIERQLATFVEKGPKVGLVYCWYRMIDEEGLVTEEPWGPVFEGDVFARHLQCSFGTGSSPLIRRNALDGVRYDPALGKAGNQGSEDWLLQLRIAARWKVACTKAFLLGYRTGRANMSSDRARMMRSHIQMLEIIQRDFPGREPRKIRRELARWRARHGLARFPRQPARAAGEFCSALVASPLIAGKTIALGVSQILRPKKRLDDHPSVGQSFMSLSPDIA